MRWPRIEPEISLFFKSLWIIPITRQGRRLLIGVHVELNDDKLVLNLDSARQLSEGELASLLRLIGLNSQDLIIAMFTLKHFTNSSCSFEVQFMPNLGNFYAIFREYHQ